MTRVEAKKQIEEFKNETNYFNNSLSYDELYDIFRNSMEFGEAETIVILASLKLVGAKFKKVEER